MGPGVLQEGCGSQVVGQADTELVLPHLPAHLLAGEPPDQRVLREEQGRGRIFGQVGCLAGLQDPGHAQGSAESGCVSGLPPTVQQHCSLTPTPLCSARGLSRPPRLLLHSWFTFGRSVEPCTGGVCTSSGRTQLAEPFGRTPSSRLQTFRPALTRSQSLVAGFYQESQVADLSPSLLIAGGLFVFSHARATRSV